MNWPCIITFKRADGAEKEIRFSEDEPGWILIRKSQSEKEFWDKNKDKSLVHTAPSECFDRIDFNERARCAWINRMYVWLKKQMELFSEGHAVRAFWLNPYYSIGGFVPNV